MDKVTEALALAQKLQILLLSIATEKAIAPQIVMEKPVSLDKDVPKEIISKEQYEDLLIELDGYPDIAEDIFKTYGISTLQNLPKEDYRKCVAKIRRIQQTLVGSNRAR